MKLNRCVFSLMFVLLLQTGNAQRTAIESAQHIADKVIRDTRFSFSLVQRPDVLGMQIIDFRFLSLTSDQRAIGRREFVSVRNGEFLLGISSSMKFGLYNDDGLIYHQTGNSDGKPGEYAYNRFDFDTVIKVSLKEGLHQFRVEAERTSGEPVVFLRWVTAAGDIDNTIRAARQPAGWMIAKTTDKTVTYPPAAEVVWQLGPQPFLAELDTDSNAAYRRDPYSDWHYSHGALVWSIQRLGDYLGDTAYSAFGRRYTTNVLDNLAYFKWQYDSLFAYRGSYHRIFRCSMLDDAGAPALPFTVAVPDQRTRNLLDDLAGFIMNRQPRLPDGIFCRPEPVAYTVWADDLFMSVPFLLGMHRITGEGHYREEAIRQVTGFPRYLRDAATGLYYHGWFQSTGKPSGVFWGRANGWVAWAMAELLDELPARHPQQAAIRKLFRAHMESLLRYQDSDGSWHQVLDKKESYKETSCTALFTLAMARGVRRGWLPSSFAAAARKGWTYVNAQISEDGVVKGICQGTEIGEDVNFYEKRKTIDNDPRGLGAVLTAALEIARLDK